MLAKSPIKMTKTATWTEIDLSGKKSSFSNSDKGISPEQAKEYGPEDEHWLPGLQRGGGLLFGIQRTGSRKLSN